MKKVMGLLSAIIMMMSVAVFADEAAANPKLAQAKELRAQSLKLQVQADTLLQQAKDLELAVLDADKKPGEKMRAMGAYCPKLCLEANRGDLGSCQQACDNADPIAEGKMRGMPSMVGIPTVSGIAVPAQDKKQDAKDSAKPTVK